jgi:ABC-type uncharacterized transport system substrate-binding protein
MASIGDAVGIGIVPSLARPGGNITGLTLIATEQSTKRIELIKEISPGLTRLAVLWHGNNASHRLQLKEMETASPVLGFRLQSVPVRDAGELDAGFQAAVQAGVQAVVTMDDQLINFLRARIVDLATRRKLPVMGEFRPMTGAGGLMNYGPNQTDMWRRTAVYIESLAARHSVRLGFSRALLRGDARNRVPPIGRRRGRGARASSALIAANSFSMARADGAPSVSFRRVASASSRRTNS